VEGSAIGESLRMLDEQKKKQGETPVCIKNHTYERLKKHLTMTVPDTSYEIPIPLKTLVNAILDEWLERKEKKK
jgi:hypothetical protein